MGPRVTLVERLSQQLADDIADGALAPGTKLDAQSLARRFDVSRTPVRETQSRLASSGLVEKQAHRGVVVATVSLERLLQMFEVMTELEGACARFAAERMSAAEKRALAESRGAMATIDNSTLDAAGIKDAAKAFAAAFDDRADRGGVDLVYDPVGGEVGEVALRALGEDGQYVVIGFVAGIPKLAANQVLLRNRRVTGVDWGAWVGRHQDENRALLAEVVERIAAGDLAPVEPVSYPLHDAARALRDLADRKVAGKVALVPSS